MKKNILLILCILNLFLMSTNVFADGYNYNGYSGNLPIEDDYDSFYRDWVSRKIIGSDDRYTVKNPHVYPYTAVCLIEAKQNGKVISSGTGFLVAPNIIATAGHVVVENGAIVDSVSCHFGCNGPNCSDCYYDVTAYRGSIDVMPGYILNKNTTNDIASINLGPTNLSNVCGYFGIKSSYGSMLNKNVRISGYPKPSANNYKTKRSIGQVTSWTSTRMEYNNDTLEGDSGAPIYTKDSTGTYIAVGVHTNAGNNGTNYNFGLPLTVSRTATFLLGDSGFTPGGDDGFQPEP